MPLVREWFSVSGSEQKYHHLVPKCYLSAWAEGNGTLLLENLKSGKVSPGNKGNPFGMKRCYSIEAGMPFCTYSDAKQFFACLSDCKVEYDGSSIDDPLELNSLYYDFDNWIITRSDGRRESNKKIKKQINKVHLLDIEDGWAAQVEDGWPKIVNQLETVALSADEGLIPEFKQEEITRFCVVQDWRTMSSSDALNSAFDWLDDCVLGGLLERINIPEGERRFPAFGTAKDELKHEFLLSSYRKYQNGSGPIEDEILDCLEHTPFDLVTAKGPRFFITSDNPSFVMKGDGAKERLMAVSPRLLLRQVRDREISGQYNVVHASLEQVDELNSKIRRKARNLLVLPHRPSF